MICSTFRIFVLPGIPRLPQGYGPRGLQSRAGFGKQLPVWKPPGIVLYKEADYECGSAGPRPKEHDV